MRAPFVDSALFKSYRFTTGCLFIFDEHRVDEIFGNAVIMPTLSKNFSDILNLEDFAHKAKSHLPPTLFGYVSGGTEDCVTLRDNRAVFNEISFLPRILQDVSKRSFRRRLFDQEYAAPFGIAPMGISALTAYRGDLVLAEAAATAQIPMIMSGSSLIRMEEVASVAPSAWFQAYLPGERHRISVLIERIRNAGFGTLVITVDTPVLANRENNIRVGFKTPLSPSFRLLWEGATHPSWTFGSFIRTIFWHGLPHFENNYAERSAPIISRNVERDFAGREHLDWDEIRAIRRQWKGHLVLKGILRADDARKAASHGVDGIIVSNHGGRQLDGSPSPIRVLPAIKDAAGKMTVMADSGFRRGTDILKGLALGADFVFIGRPFNYAAAIGGTDGVAHAIKLLFVELSAAMGLLGINRLDDLNPEMLFLKPGQRSINDFVSRA